MEIQDILHTLVDAALVPGDSIQVAEWRSSAHQAIDQAYGGEPAPAQADTQTEQQPVEAQPADASAEQVAAEPADGQHV